jgi:hypothetical protein
LPGAAAGALWPGAPSAPSAGRHVGDPGTAPPGSRVWNHPPAAAPEAVAAVLAEAVGAQGLWVGDPDVDDSGLLDELLAAVSADAESDLVGGW